MAFYKNDIFKELKKERENSFNIEMKNFHKIKINKEFYGKLKKNGIYIN